ncbi:MAG: GNAT family N-acetyltransferase [Candidatus Obscuribacterales bacterium]|nr:GNAT family N-acetyltransferase [Candidatus Obscuribacterales bacterium]
MLRHLEAFEINRVLAQNFRTWSPGLDPSRYKHYQWWQLSQDWGRRNLEYFGHFSDSGELLASCKRYKFQMQARHKSFSVAGIGAVFVDAGKRGKSYGLKMLEEMEALCLEEDFEALFLNSDIDPSYYEKLGYRLFDYTVFMVEVNSDWLHYAISQMDALSDKGLDESFQIRGVELSDIPEMCRHHKRWLARRPYGLERSEDYWRYKLGRERYLFQHSRLHWPRLEIVTDNYAQFQGGYALIESSGIYLRVLEIVAPEPMQNSLWSQILRLAKRRNVRILRGWKDVAAPLKGLKFYKRDWSFPMINPLSDEMNEQLDSWLKVEPACMLELDHF